MPTYVILLRGVMPTGKNKVLMAPLRDALRGAGLSDVRTYIQSGNVLATSALGHAELEALVHTVIKQKLGADLAIVARTAEAFRAILERNPFAGEDPARFYFTVLKEAPTPARVAALAATDAAPDRFAVVGDVVYTLYDQQHRASKFNNNYYERRLKVAATTRNFNTMTRLAALSAG